MGAFPGPSLFLPGNLRPRQHEHNYWDVEMCVCACVRACVSVCVCVYVCLCVCMSV